MTALRALLFNLGFALWTLVLGVLCLPLLVIGRRAVIPLSEFWTGSTLAWLRLAVGLDYELRGRENLPAGPALIAMKHQSAWETLVLNRLVRDPAIVAKREVLWIPLVGCYIRRVGLILIDRRGGAGAMRAMLAGAERALAQGRAVVIFPEGTRAPLGSRLPYQPGVTALYQRLGVPLVPVALNSGLFWGRRAFMKRPGRIVIEFLPAIPPGLPKREAVRILEERIESATGRLLADAGWRIPVDRSVENRTSEVGNS